MKKIALSLATIAAVCLLAVGATSAFYSDTKVVSGNTYATGSVMLGDVYKLPIAISGLYPGAEKTTEVVAIQYNGSLKGDLYYGFKVEAGHAVLGDFLSFWIEKINPDGSSAGNVYPGWVDADVPYTSWTKIASGLSQGDWARYIVHVRLDADAPNTTQNQTAFSKFIFYAVQEGGSEPAAPPATVDEALYKAPVM